MRCMMMPKRRKIDRLKSATRDREKGLMQHKVALRPKEREGAVWMTGAQSAGMSENMSESQH